MCVVCVEGRGAEGAEDISTQVMCEAGLACGGWWFDGKVHVWGRGGREGRTEGRHRGTASRHCSSSLVTTFLLLSISHIVTLLCCCQAAALCPCSDPTASPNHLANTTAPAAANPVSRRTHLLLLKPRQPYMLLAVSLSACCLICSCCSSTGSLQAAQHSTADHSRVSPLPPSHRAALSPSLLHHTHSAGHSTGLSGQLTSDCTVGQCGLLTSGCVVSNKA